MSLLAVGISHRTGPTELLEQVSAGIGDSQKLLHELAVGEFVTEAAVLSTCNRVEIYAHVTAFHGGHVEVSDALARLAGLPVEMLQPHLYIEYDARAVEHLFTVACGLDSMLVGEAQVLGQLRSAFKQAEAEHTLGPVLGEAMRHALRTGKQARSDTTIDKAGASLVSVAVAQAQSLLGDLTGRPGAIVGAGSTGALAGATLRRAGIGALQIVNRGAARGDRLATTLEATARGLDALPEVLQTADILVSSTASVGQVIATDVVAQALTARAGRPLVLIDLALPRDIDPAAASLPGVTLIDLDGLREVLADEAAGADVDAVRAIVATEVAAFLGRQRAMRVAPTVVALRAKADALVRSELDRLAARTPDLAPTAWAEVEDTVRRVVEKLIHAPTVRVKQLASDPGGDAYADALRELFELPRIEPDGVETVDVGVPLAAGNSAEDETRDGAHDVAHDVVDGPAHGVDGAL